MRALNANERDPRVINGTIRNIQQVFNTTTDGSTTINLPNGSGAVTLQNDGLYAFDLGAQAGELDLISTDAGATGPLFVTYHDSASPAAADMIGGVHFDGEDSAGNRQAYAGLEAYITDATSGSEDSALNFGVVSGGAALTALMLGSATQPDGAAVLSHIFNTGSVDRGRLALVNTATSTGGPIIQIYQDSVSPAANDYIGQIQFEGNDADGTPSNYGYISSKITDVTDGAPKGALEFWLADGTGGNDVNISALTLGTVLPDGSYGHEISAGTANYSGLTLKNTSASSGGTQLYLYADSASPAANDALGYLVWQGRDSGGATQTYAYILSFIADATATSEAAAMQFKVVTAGSAFAALTLGPGAQFGGPTGGDKGAGTVNAVAVYDDNVLLTCYPLEEGPTDVALWDSRSLTGKHDPARKFAARLGTEYDPRTIAGQRKHVRDKKHLTPYVNPDKYTEANRPSTGEWVQRTIEMTELLFCYIGELEDRIAHLEAA